MAIDYYGVNCTLASNTTPARKPKAKDRHGRLRISYDEYEASALGTNSQICLGWVPAGARILGLRLRHDALGAGVTVSVGDQFDCDRFLTAQVAHQTAQWGDCGTALVIGPVNLTETLGLHGTGAGYEFLCDTDILVTTGGDAAATGTIKLEVYYSTD
jgi:hypothetical protein